MPGGAEPTCPRHPGVVSYVNCARCGRPTCPACQRPAPVGIQCVDCVAEGGRTGRQATGRYGGALETSGAPVTVTIIALCVIGYVAQQLVPGLTDDMAFVPKWGRSQPWRFLTSAFAHGGSMHILLNMIALWQVGSGLERLLGRWRYLALYLLTALAGSVGYLLLSSPPSSLHPAGSSWSTGALGASGAVFGLFGAYLVLARRAGLDVRPMLGLLVVNALIGFAYPGIAWQAHLGGFVMGCAVAALLDSTRDPARRRLQWPALGLLLLVLVIATVIKYASVPAQFLF